MSTPRKPIDTYFKHPGWFKPLFAELDRRGLPYEKINAAYHLFDPAESIAVFEGIGINFFLLQTSPQLKEMERFSEAVIQGLA